jgi:hypothetical protein
MARKSRVLVVVVVGLTTVGSGVAVAEVPPSGRLCFAVAGSPGDAAVVNLTPVEASGAGNGQLVSSDVTSPPPASNVNFSLGTADPNVAIARIGADGTVCYVNSHHSSVHLIADHLGTITAASYAPATSSGAPTRSIDTRPPPPPPPPATYAPGQYVVGSELAPGRYVMDADAGCYWERQSGFGGGIDEVLANDFRDFASRVLVDILVSDVGFEFDADCGVLTSYQGSSDQASAIVPGMHVVGEHIVPGTYSTNADSGCYWERLTGFSGTLSDVIENEFVGSTSQQLVTIQPSDVGFSSDADCGTWQRVS